MRGESKKSDNASENTKSNADFLEETQQSQMEMVDQVKKVLEFNANYLTRINEESLYCSTSNPMTSRMTESLKNLNEIKSHIEDKIQHLKRKISQANSFEQAETPKSHMSNKKVELVNLNYKKFMGMKKESFMNLLYFFNNTDLTSLLAINRAIKFSIVNFILEKCEEVVQNFNNCYLRYLRTDKNKNTVILSRTYKDKTSTPNTNINLIIHAQITSNKLFDKTVNIGYKSKFQCDKESFKNIMRFDVKQTGPLSFWVMRELTLVRIFLI
jgi:hypothetical protein